MDAHRFLFKSCLIQVKPQLGMGNYWSVSREFLFLGVRGSLCFTDRTIPSWLLTHRTKHCRKPWRVHQLIEQVSPYLELYGREEIPNSQWTVYGNQVERSLSLGSPFLNLHHHHVKLRKYRCLQPPKV